MQKNNKFLELGFQYMLNNGKDFIFILTGAGEILALSNPILSLHDMKAEKVLGSNLFEEPFIQMALPLSRSNFKNLIGVHWETIFHFKNEYIVEWSLERLTQSENRDDIYILLGTDIGKQRYAENLAKSTQSNLDAIIALMPGNIYWMDKNSVYLGCNDNVANMLGLSSRREIIGKRFDDIVKLARWNEEQAKVFKINDIEVMATGQAKLNLEDPPVIDKDGNVIYYLTSRVPTYDEKGEVSGVIGISIDITERKKLEIDLQKAKEIAEVANQQKLEFLANLNNEVIGTPAKQYTTTEEYANSIRYYLESILACMPGNVYWMDKNSVYLGCNDNVAKMCGLKSRKEIFGITYDKMAKLAGWDKGQEQSFRKDDLEVITTGKPKLNVEEPVVYDRQGKAVHYLTSRVPIQDEGGQVVGVVGISIDITELKLLEEKLRKTEASEARFKAMSSLGGMIAHELRTPLTTIGMGILPVQQLLPQLIEGYEKSVVRGEVPAIHKRLLDGMKKSIEYVSRSIKYAQTTIATILSGLHYSDSDAEIEILPFPIKDMIEKAIAEYPFDINEQHLVSVQHIDDVLVLAEEHVVLHVLYNLFKNALHVIHAEQKGEIRIWSELNNSNLYLYIEDTAKGIPEEMLEQIFEPFFTTKKTTAMSIGMGLYFCKTVLQKMSADIACESQFGSYTRFKITLPLVKN